MKYYAAILFTILLLGGIIYIEVATWHECLTDHSWFYCMRTLN